jgi:hypothetical protein
VIFARVRVGVNHIFSIVIKTRYIVHQTIYIASLSLFIVVEYPWHDLWTLMGVLNHIDAEVGFSEHCGTVELKPLIAVALPMTNIENQKNTPWRQLWQSLATSTTRRDAIWDEKARSSCRRPTNTMTRQMDRASAIRRDGFWTMTILSDVPHPQRTSEYHSEHYNNR